jgi:glycogen operon protein
MLSHGDEIGRSQHGNNNAYCQDNELSWIDWELDASARELLAFTRIVFRIRRENPAFRRRRYFAGDPVTDAGVKDVHWLRPDGRDMTVADWHDGRRRILGMLVHGDASDEIDERGRPNLGQTLLVVANAAHRARHFVLPELPERGVWLEIVNTAQTGNAAVPPPHGVGKGGRVVRSGAVNVAPHSLMLLCHEER